MFLSFFPADAEQGFDIKMVGEGEGVDVSIKDPRKETASMLHTHTHHCVCLSVASMPEECKYERSGGGWGGRKKRNEVMCTGNQ